MTLEELSFKDKTLKLSQTMEAVEGVHLETELSGNLKCRRGTSFMNILEGVEAYI